MCSDQKHSDQGLNRLSAQQLLWLIYSRHNKNTAWNELSAGCCVHTPVNIVFIIIFFCIASKVGKKTSKRHFSQEVVLTGLMDAAPQLNQMMTLE